MTFEYIKYYIQYSLQKETHQLGLCDTFKRTF